jgi:Zn-dependent protease
VYRWALLRMDSLDLALIPLWFVAFLFSTVCHEAAHALVARWGGDLTAYNGGQVSLDPVPHIKREPFGLVLLPLMMLVLSHGQQMIGWGSAPFDRHWQIRYPRRAALMALAGPLTNLGLALVAGGCIYLGAVLGLFSINLMPSTTKLVIPHGDSAMLDGLCALLSIMFCLNVVLACLNLLPLPPLDGFSVLGLLLPERVALRLITMGWQPGFSMLGTLLAFTLFPRIISPLLFLAVRFMLSLLPL